MQPIASLHRRTISTLPITNTLTVSVAADADTTRRALQQVDLPGAAIRAARALGLVDHIVLAPGGLSWRPDGSRGEIRVEIDVRIEPAIEHGSSLSITTRFSGTDELAHDALLDAWPLVNPLAGALVHRTARTVKHHAEDDRFEEAATLDPTMRAA
jgi:hypothetical protein